MVNTDVTFPDNKVELARVLYPIAAKLAAFERANLTMPAGEEGWPQLSRAVVAHDPSAPDVFSETENGAQNRGFSVGERVSRRYPSHIRLGKQEEGFLGDRRPMVYLSSPDLPPRPFEQTLLGKFAPPSQQAVPIFFLSAVVDERKCVCLVADACNDARGITQEALDVAMTAMTPEEKGLLLAWRDYQAIWYSRHNVPLGELSSSH